MLLILILLLTFTDFELTGQNIDSEEKFKELNFWYILEFTCYIACVTYCISIIDICDIIPSNLF